MRPGVPRAILGAPKRLGIKQLLNSSASGGSTVCGDNLLSAWTAAHRFGRA
jgi:hypothetical protein